MRRLGKKCFQVQEHIFQRRVWVFLNMSNRDLAKFAKSKKLKGDFTYGKDLGFCCALEHDVRPTEWVIAIRDFHWRLADMNTLVHEIHHAVTKIFDDNGCRHTLDTQEFFATSEGRMFGGYRTKDI